ncbi:hypothetical protein F0310_04645 (plasmid) [Borrelia sp. A-FGy1]|uniref:hypothetical protein n=1 Tax=Borrelia sp. A-FGy1 TaxID=2608247 RepID=UPI0015F39D98|nr:hypothetical protein [Borrelia sp. A-FGy1]QMU99706.1 hypothetical protein F0310_04645 [Borrelia sp. A-FGy1]
MSKLICSIIRIKSHFFSYLDRVDPAGGFKSLMAIFLFGLLYFAFCYIYTLPLYRYDELLNSLSSTKKKQAWALYEEYMASIIK